MEGKIAFRLHERAGTAVLAAADAELLGKSLKFEKTGAVIEVREDFYGTISTIAELKAAFQKAQISNLMGEKTIELLGLSDTDAIILSDAAGKKIPHIPAVVVVE